MSSTASALLVNEAVAADVRSGLTATPKTLAPWLFYDEAGSRLFEQITTLPEYYLTRTERSLFAAHADEIVATTHSARWTVAELGAGTAAKTGILLRALVDVQAEVLYQPIDISPSALDEARELEATVPGVTVRPQVANYITDPVRIERTPGGSVLVLYIGSSIGNFSPAEATAILRNLRTQLRPGDRLLLGTDLAPGPHKPVSTLLAAYDDAAGVTAAFNRNVLARLNRELEADFSLDCFAHRARWNAAESRIEMHLESAVMQTVHLPANSHGPELHVRFAAGETIHTENSYKFTAQRLQQLLTGSGFSTLRGYHDAQDLFAVTIASAV